MATLIQSKQIEGIVTASVITGDFIVNAGSVNLQNASGVTGSFSGSFVGDGTGLSINYSQLQGKPTFTAGTGILITQVADTITITNTGGGGDGVSDAAAIAILNAYTASNDIVINGINLTTASLQSQINALVSVTSSYLTTDNTGSDSQTLIIVGDQLTISSGNTITIPTGSSGGGTSDFTELTNIPSGLVSSSDQILGGTGILSGSHTDISSLNQFTQSIQSQVDALIASTSSYLTSETDSQTLSIVGDQLTISDGNTITIPTGSGGGVSSWNDLTDIPSDLVSGSVLRTLDGTTVLSASVTFEQFSASLATEFQNIQHTQIPQGTISSSQQISDLGFVTSSEGSDITSLNQFTQSAESRLSALESATGSYLTSETDNQTLSIVGDQLTISDGNTITIPTGSGAGSTDISSLNQFTESIQSQIDGLSSVTSSYLTELPSGLVSGSVLRTLDGTDVLSGSILPGSGIAIDSSSGDYVITAAGGDGDTSYNGDRAVTNTLLGDLFSQSYNPGTSGSVQDFLDAIFFPSYAPTATFTTQTANLNTNLAVDGTNLESISITDTVDDSPYVVTLGGTNASSLTPVPTNADSSSWELRANGDLTAGTYTYDVTVTDSATATRTYSGRTLTIAQATNGTMSVNGTLYIIESATSGVITLSSTGRPGSTGVVSVSYSPNYGSQVATNFTSSNPLISINSSNGQLSVGSPISGSGNLSGDTITSTISWEDQYGNTDSDTISVNVTTNFAPTHSTTLTTNNNTNQATGSAQIIRLTVTDTESDSIPNSGLVWGDYNSTYFTATVSSPYMYLNANNISIPAGVYPYTASFSDIHGFRTSSYSSSVTINQAVVGTLGGDTTSYIIESAESGDSLRDVTGFNAGNSSQLTISYSPNYGSQLVQSFTSSNPSILVSNNGLLTIGVDLSGSVTQSGDTILTDITFQDQYGNQGSGSVTVNVFSNNAPSITFVSSSNYNTDGATSGSDAGTITITDTESNTPFQVSLGGTDGDKFNISGSNSPYKVQPTGSLEEGTYTISITATDDYGKTTTITNKNIIVDSAISLTPVYIYYSNYGNDTGLTNSYTTLMGAETLDSSTPPKVASYTTNTLSPYYRIKSGDLGSSTINLSGGASAVLASNVSGSDFNTTIRSAGNMGWASGVQTILIVPSGSSMTGIPTSMIDSPGGSTIGEYLLVEYADGTTAPLGATNSVIHQITLDSAIGGYSDWFVIGAKQQNNASGMRLQIIPSSGSIGNF